MIKHRYIYLSLASVTLLLGLGSRNTNILLPEFLANYAGDTLWALLVYWLIRVIAPQIHTGKSALLAISFSYLIELSQLYHAPWIDSIRAIKLGGLILGFGFKFSDIVCYSVGVCFGLILDLFVLLKRKHLQS